MTGDRVSECSAKLSSEENKDRNKIVCSRQSYVSQYTTSSYLCVTCHFDVVISKAFN